MQNDVIQLLASRGINVDGGEPWDIQVHNEKWYKRIGTNPSLGLGESYIDGWWDCDALDKFFYKALRGIDVSYVYKPTMILKYLIKHLVSNPQSRFRSRKVAKEHYNLGNDLYQHMLGDTMAYTCAYWKDADNLTDAQNAKYDLVCRKLDFQPGEKVLELGCGWGGFAHYAAKHYSVEMHSVNISTEQMAYAATLCEGLPVNLYTCDYRDIEEYNPQGTKFDKVVSIGMCEHVGYKNYKNFVEVARKNLKDNGLFLLHTIGKRESKKLTDPWIQKYIFPGGALPSIKFLAEASEQSFVMEDLHNISSDYDKTLMAWCHNFENSWGLFKEKYGERFYRMWRYYLLSCAGAFRARNLQLWQFVFSPNGEKGGYNSVR